MTLFEHIDRMILINFNKLDEVKEKIRMNLRLYGSPSVYWNQEELYTQQRCYEEFIKQLQDLKGIVEQI